MGYYKNYPSIRPVFPAVARLVQEQDTAALAIALRAAHTVKGAANLVGIRGLANLMHYTEDLLTWW